MRPVLLTALVLLVVPACGAGPGKSGAATPGDEDSTRSFDAREDEILRDLAAVDRRVAKRARMTPSEDDLRRVTMVALLREDPTVAIVDGVVDPFSFDARARNLEIARQKLASLGQAASSTGPRKTEHELLVRLVDAERARLDEERALPRSASALVRAIVDTWAAPKGEREAADADRWLTRRVDELRETMRSTAEPGRALDVVRARELDDALDALEQIASAPGFTGTLQALDRLREALEATASEPAAKAQSDWANVAGRARVHLGVTDSADVIAKDLAATEIDLGARAMNAITEAHASMDTVAATLERKVFASGPCLDAVPDSRVASMAAPPERESACHLRHLVANADGPTASAIALAALHDHVVVALWALDVARGAATIAEAQARHHLLVPVLPDTRARYERIALARPVAAIGAGETAHLLMLGGHPKAEARALSSIGDVPLDIAQRELPRLR